MALSRTAKFYRSHPKSREHHREQQAIINKRPKEVAKRVALIKFNRKQTKLGNNRVGDGTDATHRGKKIVGYSSEKRNRSSKTASPGDRRARHPKYRPGGRRK